MEAASRAETTAAELEARARLLSLEVTGGVSVISGDDTNMLTGLLPSCFIEAYCGRGYLARGFFKVFTKDP